MWQGEIAMSYVTLKISLHRSDFSRTIVVPDDWTMEKLSDAIRAVFDWDDDTHLWKFETKDGTEIGLPDMLYDDGAAIVRHQVKSARRARVRDCFPVKGEKLDYIYDFGDWWEHHIRRMSDPKVGEIACVKATGDTEEPRPTVASLTSKLRGGSSRGL